MVISDAATWIGSGFSILGAVIAIWQATRAKTAAKTATTMRNEILSKYEHGELSALDAKVIAAQNAMNKYGPGRSVASLIGTSPDDDGDKVREFTEALDRHSQMLTAAFGQPCNELRDRLHNLLNDFANAETDAERLPFGKAIYVEITTFSGNTKGVLDGKVFGQND